MSGCTYAFDEYLPQRADAGIATNAKPGTTDPPADTAVTNEDDAREASPPLDSGVFETIAPDAFVEDTIVADTLVEEDTAPPPADAPGDACTCIKYTGGKCKEWSPPGCGS